MPKAVKTTARTDCRPSVSFSTYICGWLETLGGRNVCMYVCTYEDFRDDNLAGGLPAPGEFAEFVDYVA